jgi:serine/threonine-protein kinase HipA
MTMLELDEMMERYASYEDLAEIVRHRFTEPTETLHELFARLVFNILCGNTDDHARNHAAFWDGQSLSLTPAYDICPQLCMGGEAGQAMLILGQVNASQLRHCLDAASRFLLSAAEAQAIIRGLADAIRGHWETVCDDAQLNVGEREILWNGAFLKSYAFEGLPPQLAGI